MLRSSTKAKVFVHLFQKVADSKDSVFGRTPQSAKDFYRQAHLGVNVSIQELD